MTLHESGMKEEIEEFEKRTFPLHTLQVRKEPLPGAVRYPV